MRFFKKIQMQEMPLEELEETREVMFEEVCEGKGNRKVRNALYELLGVIDSRKRFFEPVTLEGISLVA